MQSFKHSSSRSMWYFNTSSMFEAWKKNHCLIFMLNALFQHKTRKLNCCIHHSFGNSPSQPSARFFVLRNFLQISHKISTLVEQELVGSSHSFYSLIPCCWWRRASWVQSLQTSCSTRSFARSSAFSVAVQRLQRTTWSTAVRTAWRSCCLSTPLWEKEKRSGQRWKRLTIFEFQIKCSYTTPKKCQQGHKFLDYICQQTFCQSIHSPTKLSFHMLAVEQVPKENLVPSQSLEKGKYPRFIRKATLKWQQEGQNTDTNGAFFLVPFCWELKTRATSQCNRRRTLPSHTDLRLVVPHGSLDNER